MCIFFINAPNKHNNVVNRVSKPSNSQPYHNPT